MISIVYFGTEQFAARILETLLSSGSVKVVGVVTQPPRPVGRAQIITPSPVHAVASLAGIHVITPESLKDPAVHEQLRAMGADLYVVAQYGLIIPRAVLDIPLRGALNVHGSILPQYRGASPVQTALLNGEKMTGTTFMRMDEKMDHGDILEIHTLAILLEDTTESLLARLAELSCAHVVSVIERWVAGTLLGTPQNHEAATFTRMFTRANAYITWSEEAAEQIANKLRAFTPWPGIATSIGGVQYKLLAVHVSDDTSVLPPGQIRLENRKIKIGTASGILEVDSIQPAGKSPMDAAAFSNGYRSLDGATCELPPALLQPVLIK